MLPFKPESMEALRSRYHAALVPVFDCRKGVPRPRPGELRGHVFDCADGLRLIVSRDRESDAELFLHLSASLTPGLPLYDKLARGGVSKRQFIKLVLARFREVSGDYKPLELAGFSSGKGVPHWRRLESHA